MDAQAQYARLVSPAELHATLHAIDTADRQHEQEIVGRVYEKVLDSR